MTTELSNPYASPELNPYLDAVDANAHDQEKLGTLHLGLYLSACGIVAARISLSFMHFGWWPSPVKVYDFWWIAFSGVGIASLFLALLRRMQRVRTFPKSFGHWFLLIDGVGWIANQPLELLRYQLAPTSAWSYVLQVFFHLICMTMFATAIWNSPLDRSWRLYGLCRLANSGWCILQLLFFMTSHIWFLCFMVLAFSIPLLTAFAVAVIQDLRTFRDRDYLHWLGISIEGYVYITVTAQYALYVSRVAAGLQTAF